MICNEKKYVLGIDTGGTYTDSVILELESKKLICESKSLTTKGNLDRGIQNSVRKLDKNCLGNVVLVCLSTTLATNAIIEKKRCKTGLILIGKELDRETPADKTIMVRGKVDIKGNILEGVSEVELLRAINVLKEKVDAIAVSCFASIRNPKLELEVKKQIKNRLNKPVFCAHEVSGELGYYERTVTAVLNAGLVRIVEDFLTATKKVLKEEKIKCPIMVVKGDGSLTSERAVRERPIETILSGPAASVIGAGHLTQLKDAFIIDIGGTTSDMALIDNNTVKIKDEGATVGKWSTRIKAVNVCTFGLGGDSIIEHHADSTLQIGPEKVLPLCVAAMHLDNLEEVLSDYYGVRKVSTICLYQKAYTTSIIHRSETETAVLARMEHNKAYSLEEIKRMAELSMAQTNELIKNLVKNESIIKCALTPTDILHVTGDYIEFDQKPAKIAVGIYAKRLGCSAEEYISMVLHQIKKQLYRYVIQSVAIFEGYQFSISQDDTALYILDKAIENNEKEFLHPEFNLNKPIIGVGASAHIWLSDVAKQLNVELIIPQYAPVANAVGAALSQVAASLQAIIRPNNKRGDVALFMPNEKKIFSDESSARDYAIRNLKLQVESMVVYSGGKQPNIVVSEKPIYSEFFNSTKKIYIETVIDVMALSTPAFFRNLEANIVKNE